MWMREDGDENKVERRDELAPELEIAQTMTKK
jgi:hypothetical protein